MSDQREHLRLHSSENYYVEIGPMLSESMKGILGYRIVNKRTGVIEQETNVEGMAIRLMHKSEEFLAQALADPLDKAGRAASNSRIGHYLRDLQMPDDEDLQ